ncbi:hypothetical protein JAAARDRAFT_584790 [Jaapia argillacea MUCL 33604]|uniref:Uncharacterized protein n=1 Tax=Jaapia argillacea MUCL 33604 TaxID=933084 RepID=A0A067P6D7_9AGAM|nr:hypothetical protein JAAARDRAFT_584790 [Jaapia argillacea MUCL 33604]
MDTPARASMMEGVLKDVGSAKRKLEALDRRVGVLHLLTQAQASTVQTLLEPNAYPHHALHCPSSCSNDQSSSAGCQGSCRRGEKGSQGNP